MVKETLQEQAERQKTETAQEDEGKRILEQRDVKAFCDKARTYGCSFIANLFETFADIKGSNSEDAIERERRILRDQIRICQNRLNELERSNN